MPEKGKTIRKTIVEPEKDPIGTILLQKFGGRIYRGKITKYDEDRRLSVENELLNTIKVPQNLA